VRTALNYQNVTNDPTCRTPLSEVITLLTREKGLSIPNWYWRTWEVLFGVVAACIPTLRPLYKWIVEEYTRLTSGSKSSKPTTNKWTPPKPSKQLPSKSYSAMCDPSVTREEDILPLQNFEGVGGQENVEREVKQHAQGEKTDEGLDFKPGLHIHGDLSTSRPGHLKRWDSEARIGGGHGVEEVEDRIWTRYGSIMYVVRHFASLT